MRRILMEKLLDFLKCISDENRLKILKLLLDTEYCVCQLQQLLDKSQSSVSQHLSYFKKLDLLNEEKNRKWSYYCINRSVYDKYLAKLVSLKALSLDELSMLELKNNIEHLDTTAEIRTDNQTKGCC